MREGLQHLSRQAAEQRQKQQCRKRSATPLLRLASNDESEQACSILINSLQERKRRKHSISDAQGCSIMRTFPLARIRFDQANALEGNSSLLSVAASAENGSRGVNSSVASREAQQEDIPGDLLPSITDISSVASSQMGDSGPRRPAVSEKAFRLPSLDQQLLPAKKKEPEGHKVAPRTSTLKTTTTANMSHQRENLLQKGKNNADAIILDIDSETDCDEVVFLEVKTPEKPTTSTVASTPINRTSSNRPNSSASLKSRVGNGAVKLSGYSAIRKPQTDSNAKKPPSSSETSKVQDEGSAKKPPSFAANRKPQAETTAKRKPSFSAIQKTKEVYYAKKPPNVSAIRKPRVEISAKNQRVEGGTDNTALKTPSPQVKKSPKHMQARSESYCCPSPGSPKINQTNVSDGKAKAAKLKKSANASQKTMPQNAEIIDLLDDDEVDVNVCRSKPAGRRDTRKNPPGRRLSIGYESDVDEVPPAKRLSNTEDRNKKPAAAKPPLEARRGDQSLVVESQSSVSAMKRWVPTKEDKVRRCLITRFDFSSDDDSLVEGKDLSSADITDDLSGSKAAGMPKAAGKAWLSEFGGFEKKADIQPSRCVGGYSSSSNTSDSDDLDRKLPALPRLPIRSKDSADVEPSKCTGIEDGYNDESSSDDSDLKLPATHGGALPTCRNDRGTSLVARKTVAAAAAAARLSHGADTGYRRYNSSEDSSSEDSKMDDEDYVPGANDNKKRRRTRDVKKRIKNAARSSNAFCPKDPPASRAVPSNPQRNGCYLHSEEPKDNFKRKNKEKPPLPVSHGTPAHNRNGLDSNCGSEGPIGNLLDSATVLNFQVKTKGEPYTLSEFKKLFDLAEANSGHSILEIEKSKMVRGANDGKKLSQQYGRILPRGMDIIFRKAMKGIGKEHTFLDLGHGIGNTCFQAAYTIGCNAKGIEFDEDRNVPAVVFKDEFECMNRLHRKIEMRNFIPGNVEFVQGRMELPQYRVFLGMEDVDFVICNQFNGKFAGNDPDNEVPLDNYLAGLFTRMKPGGVLITLSPLRGALVCSALAEANKKRAEFGMPKSQDASFYDSEEFVLGPQSDLFSWSEFSGCTKEVSCYKYTRTKQSRGGGKAVFLCSNFTSCEYAKDSVCVPATAEDAEGRPYVSCCPNCRTDEYSMRPRKRVNYREG